jgi:hypothetical protein
MEVPKAKNIRKHGWKSQYVVVDYEARGIAFYDKEEDRTPQLTIEFEWVIRSQFT